MISRRTLFFTAKVTVSLAFLGFVLSRVDGADIAARLHSADLRWIVPALLITPVSIFLAAWRWRILSLGLLRPGEAVRYTWIGLFYGSIVPGMAGGDIAKGVALAARDARARDTRLPVSILMDKLVGFWVLLIFFYLIGLILLSQDAQLLAGRRSAVWLAGVVGLSGLLAGIGLCHPRGVAFFSACGRRLPWTPLRLLIEKISAAFASYSGRGRTLLAAASISAVMHLLTTLGFWLAMRSLAVPASPLFAAVFYPMLSVLLALPVSISGVGVRDVFSAGMFTAFGLHPEAGVAFSWLQLGLSLPIALVGGLIQLWEVFTRKKP